MYVTVGAIGRMTVRWSAQLKNILLTPTIAAPLFLPPSTLSLTHTNSSVSQHSLDHTMRRATRAAAAVAIALLVTGARALPTVSRQGRYLYNADGSRFFIKGIAYQPQGLLWERSPCVEAANSLPAGSVNPNDPNNPFLEPDTFIDPLADAAGCARDLPILQQLQINAIRVYSVNSSLNHDACMDAFSQANIYTMYVNTCIFLSTNARR